MTLWRRLLNLFRPAPPICKGCGDPFAPWKDRCPTGERDITTGMIPLRYRMVTQRNWCEDCWPHRPIQPVPQVAAILTPKSLNDADVERLKAQWAEQFGSPHPGETVVLSAGISFAEHR